LQEDDAISKLRARFSAVSWRSVVPIPHEGLSKVSGPHKHMIVFVCRFFCRSPNR